MDHHESSLRQFLLGHLDEEARQRLEEALVEDPSLFALTEAIDGEMLGELARGELSGSDAAALRTRLGTDAPRLIAFAKALDRRASSRAVRPEGRENGAAKPGPTVGGKVVRLDRGHWWRPAVAAALATAACLVPLSMWVQGDLEEENHRLEVRVAELAQQVAGGAAVKVAFALRPSTRSSSQVESLRVPAATEWVELWLETPEAEGPFRAQVTTAGGERREISPLAARREQWGSFVPFELPAGTSGRVEVVLERRSGGEWTPVASYSALLTADSPVSPHQK